MSKVLVTGSAGFIGFHLAKLLVSKGYNVVGLDNINDYYDVNLKYGRLQESGIKKEQIEYNKLVNSELSQNYKFIKLNLEDQENLNQLFENEKFDLVVNLAAQAGVRYSLENPHAYINSNIVGFTNILEACRYNSIKHLVYASSSSVYGLNKEMPFSTNDNVDHPISLYAASKKSNELMAHTYSYLFSLPTTGLRFFTVYGPWGRPDMALFIFTEAILKNKPIKVYNHGRMKRDFTYIDDIVDGTIAALDRPSPYEVFNLGNSNVVGLLEFIGVIEEGLGKKAKKEMLPMQPGDVPETSADIQKSRDMLGFNPKTSIKEGVGKFLTWYREYYKI